MGCPVVGILKLEYTFNEVKRQTGTLELPITRQTRKRK